MKYIIRTLHETIMQGQPVSKKQLYYLRQKYYCPNLIPTVQAFIWNCQTCIRSKPIAKRHLQPPLQKIYNPSNGPEDLLEIDLVGPLPPSNSYTYILTAVVLFSRFMFAIPLRRPDAQSVIKGLLLTFTRHAYLRNAILRKAQLSLPK